MFIVFMYILLRNLTKFQVSTSLLQPFVSATTCETIVCEVNSLQAPFHESSSDKLPKRRN